MCVCLGYDVVVCQTYELLANAFKSKNVASALGALAATGVEFVCVVRVFVALVGNLIFTLAFYGVR